MKHKFNFGQMVVYTGATNNYTYSSNLVKGCTGTVEKPIQEKKIQYSVKFDDDSSMIIYEEDLCSPEEYEKIRNSDSWSKL